MLLYSCNSDTEKARAIVCPGPPEHVQINLKTNLYKFGGVELVACKMTIDMMEIDKAKLIDDVIVWTAEDFIEYARECKICLFT